MSSGPAGRVRLSGSRILLLFLLLAAYALVFQGARGLWSPDEGRYVDVAMEMLRSGDWLHPFLHPEVPHYTKPPLVYWVIASSIRTFGRSEWAARLPNSVAYFGTVLLVFLLGRSFVPRRPWLPALVYATFAAPFLAANTVNTDTILTLWETLALSLFVGAWSAATPSRRTVYTLAMWTAFGLAFLTKGPPGLLPLLAVVAFVSLRDRRRLAGLFHPLGIALFLGVGATWYVVVALSRPELWARFLGDELVARIASGRHHRNPQWYGGLLVYGPMLLLGGLPWIVPLLARIRSVRIRSLVSDEKSLLLASWLLAPLVVFLLSRSRLPLYVLPLFVPLALVVARGLPESWPRSALARSLLGVWVVALVAIRGAASLPSIPLKNDRAFARDLKGLMPFHAREVVFVGTPARYGLSLYLDTDVERCDLRVPPTTDPSRESLARELEEEEHEDPRLFLTPPEHAEEVGTLLVSFGRKPLFLGHASGLAVWATAEPAARSATAGGSP